MRTCQQTDEPIHQLFARPVLHRLLRDLDRLANRLEHLQFGHLSAQRCQGSVAAEVGFDIFVNNVIDSFMVMGLLYLSVVTFLQVYPSPLFFCKSYPGMLPLFRANFR
jgi:hypothetical protein